MCLWIGFGLLDVKTEIARWDHGVGPPNRMRISAPFTSHPRDRIFWYDCCQVAQCYLYILSGLPTLRTIVCFGPLQICVTTIVAPPMALNIWR